MNKLIIVGVIIVAILVLADFYPSNTNNDPEGIKTGPIMGFYDGAQLLPYCEEAYNLIRSPDSIFDATYTQQAGICIGYVAGAMDSYVAGLDPTSQGVMINTLKNDDIGTFVKMFTAFLLNNPDKLSYSGAQLANQFINYTWPSN
jgi:hypothetical protein